MHNFKKSTAGLRWMELLKEAENPFGQEKTGQTVKMVEIEVKEILGVGYWYHGQETVAIVKDEKGKTWILPENGTLTSRHNVKEGMKLRLKITEKTYFQQNTEVFVLEQ